jgi:hypothetical protein
VARLAAWAGEREDLRDLVEITVDQAEQLKRQWIGRS